MPLYCLHCLDNETDGAERRAATRPAHLEWVTTLGETCRMAGPLLSDDGKMVGSVFLMVADSPDAARALNAQDPYTKAGVFGRVTINETRWAFGAGKPE